MLLLQCNKKGMGLIEVIIAIFLTAVGIMAILSLQPSAWKTSGKSDYLGRASGILYKTMQDNEAWIMNPCNAVTIGTTATTVRASGQGADIRGDIDYTVTTTIAYDGSSTSAFIVTVTVTWPNNTTGISESLAVARQELNRYPTGCTSA